MQYFLIFCGTILTLAVLGGIGYLINRQLTAGQDTRRRTVSQLRRENMIAADTIDAIKDLAGTWNEIESVLASQVREEIRKFNERKREIR